MEIIKILPHHIRNYFDVYYFEKKPGEGYSWYGDKKMEEIGKNLIERVTSDENQIIQIVDTNDSICEICPRNKNGKNYVQPEDTCESYNNGPEINELGSAKMLNIENFIGGSPLPAKKLFEKLDVIYKKIFTEKPNPLSKQVSLKEYFKVPKLFRPFDTNLNKSHTIILKNLV